ncbi:MAG: hypothetical protein OIF58_02645 [Cohaesibacter sp.]|nr:hypothetical protein [Cohaesibacter sp.]
MTAELKDLFYVGGLVGTVWGSHLMHRARIMVLEDRIKGYGDAVDRVMVLEERMKGYGKAMDRIFDSLKRIEGKLDEKADK